MKIDRVISIAGNANPLSWSGISFDVRCCDRNCWKTISWKQKAYRCTCLIVVFTWIKVWSFMQQAWEYVEGSERTYSHQITARSFIHLQLCSFDNCSWLCYAQIFLLYQLATIVNETYKDEDFWRSKFSKQSVLAKKPPIRIIEWFRKFRFSPKIPRSSVVFPWVSKSI